MKIRDGFRGWLVESKRSQHSPLTIVTAIDLVSNYAIKYQLLEKSLWSLVSVVPLEKLYAKLTGSNLLMDGHPYIMGLFKEAGILLLKYLREEEVAAQESDPPEDVRSQPKPTEPFVDNSPALTVINPERVIAWLVTQKNANGNFYIEHVVRQYMGALKRSVFNLQLPMEYRQKNFFSIQSPDELIEFWEIIKTAPNYKMVNLRAAGMFSAGFNCYFRYLTHIHSAPISQDVFLRQKESSVTPSAEFLDSIGLPDPRVADFNNPEDCSKTRPISLSIRGKSIALNSQSWLQTLVAVTEWLLHEQNPYLNYLYTNPLYGRQVFFLDEKLKVGTSSRLSNCKWINTNFNPAGTVTIIRRLLQHCAIPLKDVEIKYLPKSTPTPSATRRVSYQHSPAANPLPLYKIDEDIKEQLIQVLSNHFQNGFRLGSPIERTRLRTYLQGQNGKPIDLTDDQLDMSVQFCGVFQDSKVYVISETTKEEILRLAESYFSTGAQAIFFDEFFSQHETWLSSASVTSAVILINLLKQLFPSHIFTQTYFGEKAAPVATVVKDEILRVWGSDQLRTYDQLSAALQYIPISRIKSALAQNADFVWNSTATFTHVEKFSIDHYDKSSLEAAAKIQLKEKGYVSIPSLPLETLRAKNSLLSDAALFDATFQACFSGEFVKRGRIFSPKGVDLDAFSIMREYCLYADICSMEELLNYEKIITGEVYRWIALEIANEVMVRVDKDLFVADKKVFFDITATDQVLEKIVPGEYLPLKSVTTFGPFPVCGYQWNLFLLESYCRRFSRKFRFDAPSKNSRNAGTIIRKECNKAYQEIMADALYKSSVPLQHKEVADFLYYSGYTGRSTPTMVQELIRTVSNLTRAEV